MSDAGFCATAARCPRGVDPRRAGSSKAGSHFRGARARGPAPLSHVAQGGPQPTRRLDGLAGTVRLALASLLALVALPILAAETAEAHGGRLRPPKDPPPFERPPQPPSWKPPPPRQGPPEINPPPPITPPLTPVTPPATTTPPPPPQGGPTTPPGTTRPRRRGRTPATRSWQDRWQTWWELNRWRYLPGRHETATGHSPTTPRAGDEDRGRRERWETLRDTMADGHAVPALLRLLDSDDLHEEIRSATLIALAKLDANQDILARLLAHAEKEGANPLIRESAALAVGLLRRSSPERRLSPDALRLARQRLIALARSKAHARTRAFAAYSVAMLADQGYEGPFQKDGRIVSRMLWDALQTQEPADDVPVALLTALAHQPPQGISKELRHKLERAIIGRPLGKRRLSRTERAHALGALLAWDLERATPLAMRLLNSHRAPVEVRRAAMIRVGEHAGDLDADTRDAVVKALLKCEKRQRDPLSKGLWKITLAQVIAADLREGQLQGVTGSSPARRLLSEIDAGAVDTRAFASIGLALVLRDADSSDKDVVRFRTDALARLERLMRKERGDASTRQAYATAAGLFDFKRVADLLRSTLEERNEDPELRGQCGLSLAMLGIDDGGAVRALTAALWDRRNDALRSEAALALSLLKNSSFSGPLLRELERARTERIIAQLALSLGRLGEVRTVPPILDLALDKKGMDLTRALAVASIGILLDPEPRPSLFRLSQGAIYAAPTESLLELFSIL